MIKTVLLVTVLDLHLFLILIKLFHCVCSNKLPALQNTKIQYKALNHKLRSYECLIQYTLILVKLLFNKIDCFSLVFQARCYTKCCKATSD